ncbi:MAG: adenylate/guanylate cyclase domain-containing protein, partial [Ginsengibacter sp.]
ALKNATIGLHPDFKHLKGTNETEYHYIVSIFIDIHGSTNLFKKYDLEDNFSITNTIQSAAIHTVLALGGHVQRLQGDGVFAYFGGKNITKSKAVELAVTACSMFTYFMEKDLKKVFNEGGVEDIKTRIGMDFGNDSDVLWATFGVQDVNELTTLSLHTSLASKMQSKACRNGINVGQNIKNLLKDSDQWCSIISEEERYIFRDNEKKFLYTQYRFDWFNYLKSLPFIKCDASGDLYIVNLDSETERINRLRDTSKLLATGQAYLSNQGDITADSSGVQHHPHKFHYGK